MNTPAISSEALTAFLVQQLGEGKIAHLQRLSAGASADTWAVDWQTKKHCAPLILRRAAGHERFSLSNSKATEAACQQAAWQQGVPAANVIATFNNHDLGEGYFMQRIEGETLPSRILRSPEYHQAREKMTTQCGTILAILHKTPTHNIPEIRQLDALTQLTELEQFYRQTAQQRPVFELVLRWLKNHIPISKPDVLVHGDFRHGNFIVNETGIIAVLDWELSHLGDAMEDLGWLCVNAWRFGAVKNPVGGFGQRETLFTAYEQTSGQKVDPVRVRYWELFGNFKWGVICLFQAWSHLSGHVQSLERAVIGRRACEAEIDMLACLQKITHAT
jgi:aminoglycoside phosphotransferase (APT) family kinase protein